MNAASVFSIALSGKNNFFLSKYELLEAPVLRVLVSLRGKRLQTIRKAKLKDSVSMGFEYFASGASCRNREEGC